VIIHAFGKKLQNLLLTPIDNKFPQKESSCSFASSIPSTGEILYVSVSCQKNKKDCIIGEVIACSYDAIATAALLQAIKLAFV